MPGFHDSMKLSYLKLSFEFFFYQKQLLERFENTVALHRVG